MLDQFKVGEHISFCSICSSLLLVSSQLGLEPGVEDSPLSAHDVVVGDTCLEPFHDLSNLSQPSMSLLHIISSFQIGMSNLYRFPFHKKRDRRNMECVISVQSFDAL